MATSGYSPVKLSFITKTGFYCEVIETDADLCDDSFRASVFSVGHHLLRSGDNKYVVVNSQGEFQAQNLSADQQQRPENIFYVQEYNSVTKEKRLGRAVMLYVIKGNEKMVACCSVDNEIHPEKMDIPDNIGEEAHKAVFYRTEVSSSKYLLESSLYPDRYLAFKSDTDNNLTKLVLRSKDVVDEPCHVNFSSCNK